MVIRTARRARSRRSTAARSRPRSMRPDSFWENGAPLAFNDGALQRHVGRHPGHACHLGARAAPLRHLVARASAARPASAWPATASPSTRPSSTRPTPQRRLVQRHPLDRRDLPRPRRHAARRRHDPPEPRPRAHLPADRAREGADALLPRRARERDGRAPSQHPPMAADANHAWRPGLMTTRRPARATAPSSARRPASATAASTSGAWARRRAAARPSARRSTSSRATSGLAADRVRGAPPASRGVALHVRRPQRLPRRPGLLRRAARRPPLRQLRGRAARADRRDRAATSPVAPGDPYDNQDGRQAPPRQRHGQPPAPVDHPPGRLGPQGQRRLLHVHDRVDRRQRDRRARLRLPA